MSPRKNMTSPQRFCIRSKPVPVTGKTPQNGGTPEIGVSKIVGPSLVGSVYKRVMVLCNLYMSPFILQNPKSLVKPALGHSKCCQAAQIRKSPHGALRGIFRAAVAWQALLSCGQIGIS